jgi:hypothetical protein
MGVQIGQAKTDATSADNFARHGENLWLYRKSTCEQVLAFPHRVHHQSTSHCNVTLCIFTMVLTQQLPYISHSTLLNGVLYS